MKKSASFLITLLFSIFSYGQQNIEQALTNMVVPIQNELLAFNIDNIGENNSGRNISQQYQQKMNSNPNQNNFRGENQEQGPNENFINQQSSDVIESGRNIQLPSIGRVNLFPSKGVNVKIKKKKKSKINSFCHKSGMKCKKILNSGNNKKGKSNHFICYKW